MLTVLMYAAYAAFGLVALLMVFAILLQEGKGGGLSALGGTQAESAFGSSNPIRRATVILSIIFFVLAGVLTYVRSGRRDLFEDGTKKEPETSLNSDVPTGTDEEGAKSDDASAEKAGSDAETPTKATPADAADGDVNSVEKATDAPAPADGEAAPTDPAPAKANPATGELAPAADVEANPGAQKANE